MKVLLLICLLAFPVLGDDLYTEIHGDGSATLAQKDDAKARLNRLKREFDKDGLLGLAYRTDSALKGIVYIGARNLRRRGFHEDAKRLEQGWRQHEGTLPVLLMKTHRDIGDFKPLSTYLAIAYELLELRLGYDVCRALRLSDIKTLNYAIPVVFSPCEYNAVQFELHFVHDAKYRGLFPVVTYWTTTIACTVATFGAGYFFICSPIAMLVERGADEWLGPWLAPRLYEAFCGQGLD